ncbi:MAG: transcriptional regulator, partial [Glaciihabitans sp.]|nr:transcriptional regulator [Glaciihabitans sp.]
VFGIAVGKVLREVESSLVELDSVPAEDPADELARRRATRAS